MQMLFLSAMMLAFEAGDVIDTRLRKIATGGVEAASETRLMIMEKIDAAFEAGSILARGGDTSEVIDNYRRHVAANAARLG
jgi:hypothetical protein